jgi:hypothetical protein
VTCGPCRDGPHVSYCLALSWADKRGARISQGQSRLPPSFRRLPAGPRRKKKKSISHREARGDGEEVLLGVSGSEEQAGRRDLAAGGGGVGGAGAGGAEADLAVDGRSAADLVASRWSVTTAASPRICYLLRFGSLCLLGDLAFLFPFFFLRSFLRIVRALFFLSVDFAARPASRVRFPGRIFGFPFAKL